MKLLNAACSGNIALFKSKFSRLFLDFSFCDMIMMIVETDLAKQLDNGKGLAGTVADVKDANKRGALIFAAREGQTEFCEFMVEELKLDVNTKDEEGNFLLLTLSSFIKMCAGPNFNSCL